MLDVSLDTLVTGSPFILAFMGIYLVFVMRSDFDLTIEASFATGGALTAVSLLHGVPMPFAMAAGVVAAGLMGVATTLLHIYLKVPIILAGLVMSIGFYSVNLRILNNPTISLAGTGTLFSRAQVMSRPTSDFYSLGIIGAIVVAVLTLLFVFLLTDAGLALRSSGVNPIMTRSLGINDRFAAGASLAIANCLAGLSGSLVAQNQSFADISMGTGILLSGIGGVMIGDLLFRPTGSRVGRAIISVSVGALTYRLVLVLALRFGLDASDLNAVTALTLITAFGVQASLRHVLTRRALRRYRRAWYRDNPSVATPQIDE